MGNRALLSKGFAGVIDVYALQFLLYTYVKSWTRKRVRHFNFRHFVMDEKLDSGLVFV